MHFFFMVVAIICFCPFSLKAQESERSALQKLASEIRQSQKNIDLIDAEIAKLQDENSALEQSIETQRYKLAKNMHALYVLEQRPAYLAFLAGDGTVLERYYNYRSHQNARALLRVAIKDAQSEMAKTATTLENINDFKRRQNLLDLSVQASLEQINTLSKKIPNIPLPASFTTLINDLKAEKTNLDRFIQGIIDLPSSGNDGDSYISFILPVSGVISQEFTPARAGIEITATPHALVTAPADGVISYADTYKNFGPIVIIRHHRKYVSVMRGFEQLFIKTGQSISQNAPIGTLSAQNITEKTNGAMLYYELRYNGNTINPLTSLSGL